MSDPRTRSEENNRERQAEPHALPASSVSPKEQQGMGAIPGVDDTPDVTAYANDAEDSSPPGSDPDEFARQPTPLTFTPADPNAPHSGLILEEVPWEPINPQPAPADPSDQDRIVSDLRATQLPLPAASSDDVPTAESSKLAANLARPPADPSVRQTARVPGLTPTILARRDVVTVLIRAPFDAWYDQWMLQADNAEDAADPDGVDFFDDAVRLFEPAASGMAIAALRAHLDAHAAAYAAAGVALLVEPRLPQDDEIVCLLGVFETMHEDGEGRRMDGELSFVETVAHDAIAGMADRAAGSPFPVAVFAPGDSFFSAIDDSPLLSDATLAEVRARPEQYALVDVQVTVLYARVQLLGQTGDDPAERALTA